MAAARNRAGREIWFRHVEGGAYRSVAPQGTRAFVLAALWLLICAALAIAAFAITFDLRYLIAMVAAGAAGLIAFATTVYRHS